MNPAQNLNQLAKIKEAFERKAALVARRPYIGQNTAITKIRLLHGLTCEVEEGRWTFKADMSPKSGGMDEGPNPGLFGRAALGSCIAMSYVMWAAKLDIPLTRLEVEIQADYDVRGAYGVAKMPAGYLEVRYIVSVESPAGQEEVTRLFDIADEHIPYLDVFGRSQKLHREIRFLTPKAN